MERIVIIGCTGSGKTKLARDLGKKLGIQPIDLDWLWWKKGEAESSREEFDRKLTAILEQPRWIIDGNYSRTMEQRLEKCDTIVYLDFSRWSCLLGAFQRAFQNRGRKQDTPGSPDKLDMQLIRWIWNYKKNNRVLNSTWLARARHAQVFVLKNRRDVRRFLEEI